MRSGRKNIFKDTTGLSLVDLSFREKLIFSLGLLGLLNTRNRLTGVEMELLVEILCLDDTIYGSKISMGLRKKVGSLLGLSIPTIDKRISGLILKGYIVNGLDGLKAISPKIQDLSNKIKYDNFRFLITINDGFN